MKLIILIPSYNEAETIEGVINNIPQTFNGIDQIVTLVIDDGSIDQTAQIAKTAGAMVISHPRNLGVGRAFNTGLLKVLELNADIMVNIDADGQFSPEEIQKLIDPILENKADFVSGDRFTDEDGVFRKPLHMAFVKYWGNKWMARLISMLSNQDFRDVSCGFRAYSKEALLWLNLSGQFTYTQESFLDFAYKGLNIKTVPVSVKYFPDRQSKVAGNLLHYILRTMKIIMRAYRDYRPFHFFGWLSLPPFIIAIACGIFMLVHYILTSGFSPYKFIGFAGIYLGSLAILFFIVGLLADMFRRIRTNQERLLYYEKKRQYQDTQS